MRNTLFCLSLAWLVGMLAWAFIVVPNFAMVITILVVLVITLVAFTHVVMSLLDLYD